MLSPLLWGLGGFSNDLKEIVEEFFAVSGSFVDFGTAPYPGCGLDDPMRFSTIMRIMKVGGLQWAVNLPPHSQRAAKSRVGKPMNRD